MFLLKPQHPPPAAQEDARGGARALTGEDLAADEWTYVAEGGANVLFRHHPTPATSARAAQAFRGKLLRVKKCDVDGIAVGGAAAAASAEDESAAAAAGRKRRAKHKKNPRASEQKPYVPHYPHPRQVLEYATNDVMPYMAQQLGGRAVSVSHSAWPTASSPALSSADNIATSDGSTRPHPHNVYVQVAELLEVERRFLVQLNARLLALETRPPHRRGSQIDVALQCVMVLPDVTLPPPDDDNQLLFEDVDNVEVAVGGKDQAHAIPEEDEDEENGSMTDQTDEDDTETELSVQLDEATNSLGSSSNSQSSSASNSDGEDQEEEEAAAATPASRPTVKPAAGPSSLIKSTSSSARHLLRRGISDSFRNGSIFDCCFRNICVELKPKIGFLPHGALIPAIKTRVCRFCMHQHYKKAAGKVEEISEYCPLDLFSRDAPRIRHALRALQRTPQNNFKVFVRSNKDEVVNVITGMNADALPKGASQARYSFCRRKRMGFRHSCQSMGYEHDLVGRNGGDCDTDEKHRNCTSDDDEHLLPDVVDLLTQVLLQLDILEDLKRLQMLDHISADGVWHVQRLLQRVEAVAPASEDDSGEGRPLGELVEAVRAQSGAGSSEDDEGKEGSLARSVAFLQSAIDEIPDLQAVIQGAERWQQLSLGQLSAFYGHLEQRFQVATTLKDCSLLLCLRRSTDEEKQAAGGAGKKKKASEFDHLVEYEHPVAFRHLVFNCVVAIVDLDVKSHKSVGDYFSLDDKIVTHYARSVADAHQPSAGLDADCCYEV
jgi:hypothetical protein